MNKLTLQSSIILTILLFSINVFTQTDVPTPFEEEGFLYDYPSGAVIVLDVGKNLFETSDSLNIKFDSTTKFTDKKGKKSVKMEEFVPGSKIKITGDRLRLSATYKAKQVRLISPPKAFKVNGYFERLDKTSAGEIAWVSGQAVKLGEGVVIKGEKEWKGKSFASFNEMMLGSKLEIKVKMDPEDKRFIVSGGKTRPNLYSVNDKKLKDKLKKKTNELVSQLTLTDTKLAIDSPGTWHFKNTETGKIIIGQIPQPKPNSTDTFQVEVAGRQYDLTSLPKYVSSVGNKLIPQYMKDFPDNDPGKINFRFYIVNKDTFNAFALPDGTIVLHTGLLKMLRNESQLASVLGHEIAHVTHEHSRRQMELNGKTTWLKIGAGMFGGILAASSIELVNLGFARQLEDEADRVGLFYAANAGFDPRESPKVWQQLVDLKGESSEFTNFFTSKHSVPEDRLKNLNKELYRHYKNYDYDSTDKGVVSYVINVGTAFDWVDYSQPGARALQKEKKSNVNAPKSKSKNKRKKPKRRKRP